MVRAQLRRRSGRRRRGRRGRARCSSVQRRSVSMVEPVDHQGAVEQALELVERLVGVRGGGEGAREGELVVAARPRRRRAGCAGPAPRSPGAPARLAGAEKLLTACAAYAGIREEPNASVSVAMLPRTSVTKSVAAQLGVAGHVPGRTPAQRTGQRVVEAGQTADDRRQRAVVEADLRVGQVAVVEQQQVGLPHARPAPRSRCARPRRPPRRGYAGPAGRLTVVVQADADPVTAQRRVLDGGASAAPRTRRSCPSASSVELGGEGVHAAGLQPLLGPGVQLAARGGFSRRSAGR